MIIAWGDRVEGKSGSRPAPRDNAENEENTATDQVEGQQFAQRMWMENEAVEPETDQSRANQPREN
jgi:hypothetical protein